MSKEDLARIVHEMNRRFCELTGDTSQKPWEQAEQWQRDSCFAVIEQIAHGTTPEAVHDLWCSEKRAAGWVYGSTKCGDAKTHPCLVPYAEIDSVQRTKDALVTALVLGLRIDA